MQIDEWLNLYSRNDARLITIAMVSNDLPLSQQLTDLQQAFKRLRRHILWKNAVRYGKAIIEITYNNKTNQWHPHLHIIAIGSYIPQAKLSRAWETASGGAYVADIRKIKQNAGISCYLGEYLGKPPRIDDDEKAFELMSEFYMAIRNRRMLLSFAGAPPLPPLPKSEDPPEENDEWVNCGTLEDVLFRADAGDRKAQALVESLSNRLNGETPAPES